MSCETVWSAGETLPPPAAWEPLQQAQHRFLPVVLPQVLLSSFKLTFHVGRAQPGRSGRAGPSPSFL